MDWPRCSTEFVAICGIFTKNIYHWPNTARITTLHSYWFGGKYKFFQFNTSAPSAICRGSYQNNNTKIILLAWLYNRSWHIPMLQPKLFSSDGSNNFGGKPDFQQKSLTFFSKLMTKNILKIWKKKTLAHANITDIFQNRWRTDPGGKGTCQLPPPCPRVHSWSSQREKLKLFLLIYQNMQSAMGPKYFLPIWSESDRSVGRSVSSHMESDTNITNVHRTIIINRRQISQRE